MSVARCQAEVNSREFAEWQAYRRIEPWGLERGDLNAAMVCAVIANVNAAKGRRYKPSDFMPRFDAPRRQSAEEMQRRLMGIIKMQEAARGKHS